MDSSKPGSPLESPTTGQVYLTSEELSQPEEVIGKDAQHREVTTASPEKQLGLEMDDATGQVKDKPRAVKVVEPETEEVKQLRKNVSQVQQKLSSLIASLAYHPGDKTVDKLVMQYIQPMLNRESRMELEKLDVPNQLKDDYNEFFRTLNHYCGWILTTVPPKPDRQYLKTASSFAKHDKKFQGAAENAPVKKGTYQVGPVAKWHQKQSWKLQQFVLPEYRDQYKADMDQRIQQNPLRSMMHKSLDKLEKNLHEGLGAKPEHKVVDTGRFKTMMDDWTRSHFIDQHFPGGYF